MKYTDKKGYIMKNLTGRYKSLIALLLAMIMMIGSVLPVFANTAGNEETGSAEGEGGVSSDAGQTEIDTGWFKLQTTADGITVILDPDKDALLNITAAQIKIIIKELLSSLKNVIADQVMNDWIVEKGADPSEPAVIADGDIVVNSKTLDWTTVLSKFIENEYGAATKAEYDEFFGQLSDASDAKPFIDYASKGIEFAVSVGLSTDSLPENDGTLGTRLINEFKSHVLDVTGTDYEAQVIRLVDAFIPEYDKLRERMVNTPPKLSLQAVFDAFKGISVDNLRNDDHGMHEIIKDGAVNESGLKKIISEILDDIKVLSEVEIENMFVSYKFLVDTIFGSTAFSITVKLDEDCPQVYLDRLKAAIDVAKEHFYFDWDGTYFTVKITLPELFSDVLRKGVNSDKFSEELKKKLFKLTDSTVEDVYGVYGDFTFGELIELLEAVDFEGIISKVQDISGYDRIRNILKRFIDPSVVENMTNEQLVEKAREYEGHFNRFKDKISGYVSRVYDYLPDKAKDKTLSDFYSRDGVYASFSGVGDVTLTEKMFNKAESFLMDRFPEYESAVIYLMGLLRSPLEGRTFTLDLTLNAPSMGKITFMSGSNVIREGFLPEGAADPVRFIEDITVLAGREVLAWKDADGNEHTEMPDGDLVLYAELSPVEIEIIPDSIFGVSETGYVLVYDGNNYNILAKIDETLASYGTVTYKWYKDGSETVHTEGDTISVGSVSDSGKYKVVATIVYDDGTADGVFEYEFDVAVGLPVFELTLEDNPITEQEHELNASFSGGIVPESGITYTWYYGTAADALSPLTGVSGDSYTVQGSAASGFYKVVAEFAIDGQTVTVESNVVEVSITDEPLEFTVSVSVSDVEGELLSRLLTATLAGNYATYTVKYQWYYGTDPSDVNTPIGTDSPEYKAMGLSASGYYRCEATVTVGEQSEIFSSEAVNVIIDPCDIDFNFVANTAANGDFSYILSIDELSVIFLDGLNTEIDAGNYTVKYEWFFGDSETPIDGADESSYIVSGVNASGIYRVKITVTLNGYDDVVKTKENVYDEIIIEKKVINLADIWNYDAFDILDDKVIYSDGLEHTVNKPYDEAIVSFSGTLTSAGGGKYTATATILDTENYVFEGDLTEVSLEWFIVEQLSLTADPDFTVSVVYDGNTHTVKILIPDSLSEYTVTYQWYKVLLGEDTLIEDNTTDTLSFVNVSDSGIYKCVVTVDSFGYIQTAEAELDITVTPAVIDVNDFEWTSPENFTYDGTDHVITVVRIPEAIASIVVVDYDALADGIQDNIVLRKPGSYTVAVSFSLTDTENYSFADGEIPTYNITVEKADFDMSKITWSYKEPFKFAEGTEHSVRIEGYEDFTFGDIVVLYSEDSINSAIAIGTYTAVFQGFKVQDGEETFALTDYYNVIGSFDVTTLSWVIETVGPPIVDEDNIYIYDEEDGYVKVIDPDKRLLGYKMYITRVYDYEYLFIDGTRYKALEAYDIVFRNELGEPPTFEITDRFEVFFKIPAEAGDKDIYVILVDEEGDLHSIIASELLTEEGFITFDVSHFSVYGISIEAPEEIIPPPPAEEPSDELTPKTKIFIIGAVLFVLMLLVLIGKIIRKSNDQSRLKSHMIVTEYDETVELYEDLKKYQTDVNSSVYIEGETPPDSFIKDSPIDTRGFVTIDGTGTAGISVPDKKHRRKLKKADVLNAPYSQSAPIVIGRDNRKGKTESVFVWNDPKNDRGPVVPAKDKNGVIITAPFAPADPTSALAITKDGAVPMMIPVPVYSEEQGTPAYTTTMIPAAMPAQAPNYQAPVSAFIPPAYPEEDDEYTPALGGFAAVPYGSHEYNDVQSYIGGFAAVPYAYPNNNSDYAPVIGGFAAAYGYPEEDPMTSPMMGGYVVPYNKPGKKRKTYPVMGGYAIPYGYSEDDEDSEPMMMGGYAMPYTDGRKNRNNYPVIGGYAVPANAPANNQNYGPVVGGYAMPYADGHQNRNNYPAMGGYAVPYGYFEDDPRTAPMMGGYVAPYSTPANNQNYGPVVGGYAVPANAPANNQNYGPVVGGYAVPANAPANNQNYSPVIGGYAVPNAQAIDQSRLVAGAYVAPTAYPADDPRIVPAMSSYAVPYDQNAVSQPTAVVSGYPVQYAEPVEVSGVPGVIGYAYPGTAVYDNRPVSVFCPAATDGGEVQPMMVSGAVAAYGEVPIVPIVSQPILAYDAPRVQKVKKVRKYGLTLDPALFGYELPGFVYAFPMGYPERYITEQCSIPYGMPVPATCLMPVVPMAPAAEVKESAPCEACPCVAEAEPIVIAVSAEEPKVEEVKTEEVKVAGAVAINTAAAQNTSDRYIIPPVKTPLSEKDKEMSVYNMIIPEVPIVRKRIEANLADADISAEINNPSVIRITRPDAVVKETVVEPVEEIVAVIEVEEPIVETEEETGKKEVLLENPYFNLIIDDEEEEETEEEPIEEESEDEELTDEEAAEEEPAEEEVTEEETSEEEPVEEEYTEEEPTEEESLEEEPTDADENDSEDDSDDDSDSDDDDEDGDEDGEISKFNGMDLGVRYRKSFTARLILSSNDVKEYYSMIKNAFLSFKGVKVRTSWNYETFNRGRNALGKLYIRGKTLVLCLAHDVSEYEGSKYHFKDVSEKAKYRGVPMLLKVKSSRGVRYAVDLIGELMEKKDIPIGNISDEDFRPEEMTMDELVEKKLVKVVLPKGVEVDENDTVVAMDEEGASEGEELTEEEALAEESTEEEAPAEESTEEEAPAEESTEEEAPAEESTEEEAPVEESTEEEAPAEESTEEEVPAEESSEEDTDKTDK